MRRSDRSRAGSRPHQFERAYWESGSDWAYADAARRGSSHLKLPKVLHFFTGNIGFHHVHPLECSHARIPNYDLALAHRENQTFTTCRRSRSGTLCARCGRSYGLRISIGWSRSPKRAKRLL